MDVLILIGRILFALLFLAAGIMGHLKATDDMAGWSVSRGLPAARPLVLVSGLWIVVGSLFVILGVWADLGFLMLAAFALAAAFLVHNFWRDTNPMEAQNQQAHFMKGLALAGAGLVMFVFFASAGDAIGFQITDPLFSIDL